MRIAHVLKPNKAGQSPYNLLFIDTETETVDPSEEASPQRLKLWIACHSRKQKADSPYSEAWYDGTDSVSLKTLVVKLATSKRPLNVFASNIYFDMAVSNLYRQLIDDGWKLGRHYAKGLVIIMTVAKGSKKINFYNLQNWIDSSIEAIGRLLDKPKLEIDLSTCSEDQLFTYCHRDVEILRDIMLQYILFLKENDLGNFQRTKASQSFTAYRHRFMEYPIYIHNNDAATTVERASYFGGRCEAFFIGDRSGEKISVYDVTSLYPFVMQENFFPARLWFHTRRMTLTQLRKLLLTYCVIAEVELDTHYNIFPIHLEGKTIFPVGRFTTTLCTEALSFALGAGAIRKIVQAAVYHKEKIFRQAITELWELRKGFLERENKVFATLTKFLMNTLYGKFAQYSDECLEEEIEGEPRYGREFILDDVTGKRKVVKYLGSKSTTVLEKNKESFNSFSGISSHITEYGRMYLYKMMSVAGMKNVLYCDTDSLFVTEDGKLLLKPYIAEKELGKLKLEKEGNDLVIRCPKDYTFGGKEVVKGIRKNAVQLGPNTYLQDLFPGFASDLARQYEGFYSIRHVRKVLKRIYDKGYVQPDGRVLPLRIGD